MFTKEVILTQNKKFKLKANSFYAEYDIPRIKKSQLHQLVNNSELEHLGGVLGFLTCDKIPQVAILDKIKPHSYYDLMLFDMDVNRSNIMKIENNKLKSIMYFAYNFICFITRDDIVNKFGLKKNLFKIIYNYSDFINDSTAMSLENFHIHLNNISNIEFDSIQEKRFQISNLDPSVPILSYLLIAEINRQKYEFIDKIFCSGLKEVLVDKTPYGLIIETNCKWSELNSNYLILFLKEIHEKIIKINNKFEAIISMNDFDKLEISKVMIENYIEILKQSNYNYIQGVNYSVTLYNNDKNNSISILVQPKQFSTIGGAGETFISNKYSLLKVNRKKIYFSNEELLKRRLFQKHLVDHINNTLKE